MSKEFLKSVEELRKKSVLEALRNATSIREKKQAKKAEAEITKKENSIPREYLFTDCITDTEKDGCRNLNNYKRWNFCDKTFRFKENRGEELGGGWWRYTKKSDGSIIDYYFNEDTFELYDELQALIKEKLGYIAIDGFLELEPEKYVIRVNNPDFPRAEVRVLENGELDLTLIPKEKRVYNHLNNIVNYYTKKDDINGGADDVK